MPPGDLFLIIFLAMITCPVWGPFILAIVLAIFTGISDVIKQLKK